MNLIPDKANLMSVRKAHINDIAHIHRLVQHYALMGNLLPRSQQDIVDNLAHFRVIGNENVLFACGSLEHFSPSLAEIRSLMVVQDHKQQGLGKRIVEELINLAKQRGVNQLMALTYTPDFFHKLGFNSVDKAIFPEKVWGVCVNCYKFDNCDEIAVLLEL